MHDIIEIKFSPQQVLPRDYKVVWFEGDEHYHWTNDELDIFDGPYSSRWQAWRVAKAHYEKTKC